MGKHLVAIEKIDVPPNSKERCTVVVNETHYNKFNKITLCFEKDVIVKFVGRYSEGKYLPGVCKALMGMFPKMFREGEVIEVSIPKKEIQIKEVLPVEVNPEVEEEAIDESVGSISRRKRGRPRK